MVGAVAKDLDDGTLEIQGAVGEVLGVIKLATFRLPEDGEAEATNTDPATATGSGTATIFVCRASNGDEIGRGTIGKKGSELELSSRKIVAGGKIVLTKFVLRA